MTFSHGIDVSHFQSTVAPAGVPWSLLKSSGVEFVMIRATYGTYKDPSAVAHVRAARAVGMQVGLYAFSRQSQPVTDQLAAFNAQAIACGIKAGDIAPAHDLEDEPGVPKMNPLWCLAAEAFTAGLVASYGDALMYVTQRDFGRLGSPGWILDRPLWVAHYTGAPAPATPGNRPWRIWQHRVGPFSVDGPGGAFQPQLLDQNRGTGDLPVCSRVPGVSGSLPPPPEGPAPQHEQGELWGQRLDSLTLAAYEAQNTGHTATADDERDTEPAPPLKES